MKNTIYPFLFCLPFLLVVTFTGSAQDTPNERFDAIVGLENSDLSNGVEYIEQHVIRNNKHKFFSTEKFTRGRITYSGQTYLNIPLKYNVYDDLLLVRIKNSGGESVFQLHKDEVESFSIGDHYFTKLDIPEKKLQGFYESLLQNAELHLIKKHLKKQKKHLDKNFTYYEFEQDSPQYFLLKEQQVFQISSRRDIIRLFPENEQRIRQYYRTYKSQQKSDHDRFLLNLFNSLD